MRLRERDGRAAFGVGCGALGIDTGVATRVGVGAAIKVDVDAVMRVGLGTAMRVDVVAAMRADVGAVMGPANGT